LGRGKLHSIKRRIESTRSTEHITHAMEMVATAKVNKVVRLWRSYLGYVDAIDQVVSDCLSEMEELEHPLILKPGFEPKKTSLLTITSDMGLCGSFNLDVLRTAEQFGARHKPAFAGYFVVGTKGWNYLRYRKQNLLYAQDKLYDTPGYSIAEMLANRVLSLFEEGKTDSIQVMFSEFRSSLVQRPTIRPLLPLQLPEPKAGEYRVEYEFEPEPMKFFQSIIPLYLSAHILSFLLEAKVSELYSRQNAMRNATENAENMIERFTLEFNKARQGAITQEIIEIVNGAEALAES